MFGAVPEGVSKLGIVLDGNGVDCAANLKGAFLKLHHASVVNAGACMKK